MSSVGRPTRFRPAPEDRRLQDVLVCICRRLPLTRARPYLRQGAGWRLRSPGEMARRFAELPAALRGTREVADRCGFALAHIDPRLPLFPVPAGHTSMSYLRLLATVGARERYGEAAEGEAVRTRLAHELAVIEALGMLCQARGSSVGSTVCYCDQPGRASGAPALIRPLPGPESV